jgi:hypothetical protein
MPCSPGFLPGSAARGGTVLIKYGSIRQYSYRPGKRTSRAGDGNRTRAISLGTGEATLMVMSGLTLPQRRYRPEG